MTRFPRRQVTGAAKRQVTWVGPADQGYISVTGNSKVLIGSLSPTASGIGKPTVVRTRGQVSVKPTTYAADIETVGAFGIAIVSAQAFGIGITAIPGPFIDSDWDGWFVWRSFSFAYEFHDATASLLGSFQQEVDSKAMRKVSENETIVLVAESQSGGFDISFPIRMLLKLA